MILCPYSDLSRYASVIPGLEEAMAAIDQITDWTPRTIPLSGSNRIMVQEYTTRSPEGGNAEAHRQFLDIQYIVAGEEAVGWAPLASLTPVEEFSTEKDVGFYAGPVEMIRVTAGNCYVVFPEDAHLPGVYMTEPGTARKLVVKLKV